MALMLRRLGEGSVRGSASRETGVTDTVLERLLTSPRLLDLVDADESRLLVRVAEPGEDGLRVRLHLYRRRSDRSGWGRAAVLLGSAGLLRDDGWFTPDPPVGGTH